MLLESIGGESNIVDSEVEGDSTASTPATKSPRSFFSPSSSSNGSNNNVVRSPLQLTQNRNMTLRYMSSSSSREERRSSSAIMTTETMDFPCIEASRCYLTEKEHGKRLTMGTIKQNNFNFGNNNNTNNTSNTGATFLGFSKQRSKLEEWYVTLDTVIMTPPPGSSLNNMKNTSASAASPSSASSASPAKDSIVVRVLQLRHCVTGLYLSSNENGHITTVGTCHDDESTWWIMEPKSSLSPTASPTANDYVEQQHQPIYYVLRSKANPQRCLKYNAGENLLLDEPSLTISQDIVGDQDLVYLHTTKDEEMAAIWELEFSSGELCFMSNPVVHAQIRCNPLGMLSLSQKLSGWEVFRFIEVGHGNVAISSWTHTSKYLSSDPDGVVKTTENRLGHWEKWKLQKTDNGVHIISVAHPGRYLSVCYKINPNGRGDALHTTTKPGDFSKWHLEAAHSHVYCLKSTVQTTSKDFLQKETPKDMFLSSNKRGAFLSKHRRDWEQWRMDRTHDGCITLFSVVHKNYLGSNSMGDIVTTASKGDWSIWEMEESPYGGIFLRSKPHNRILAVDSDEKLCTTVDRYTELETWILEPSLPPSLSGNKIMALGVAGALGVALTVAMPYAVLGAVEAAGGMATASTLLAGFSAEAVAGFGGGALLGASVVGTTAALAKDEQETSDGMPAPLEIKEDYLIGSNSSRPISAWRYW